MEAVWPNSLSREDNLAQAISKLRQVFGEIPGSHSYIVIVPGRGYRFVAEVGTNGHARARPESTSAPVQPLPPASDTGLGDAVSMATTQSLPVISQSQHHLEVSRSSDPEGFWDCPRQLPGCGRLPSRQLLSFASQPYFLSAITVCPRVRARPVRLSRAEKFYLCWRRSRKSGAVLPFDNLSDDKQNAYFAIGVQDEITSDLARIADLKVISRTSANLYKSGNPRNSREIGQQLGVAHLLEGSVQRIGNRLRVNAQLIKVPTDTHVWAQTYDRDVADLFAVGHHSGHRRPASR